MSDLSTVAQSVVDVINAGVTAGDFTPWNFAAIRTYDAPRRTALEEIDRLTVLVMATGEQSERASRGATAVTITVQVAVIKKLETLELSNSELDAMNDLVESINDAVQARGASLPATPMAMRRAPIYDAEMLQTMGLFAAVTEHDFLKIR